MRFRFPARWQEGDHSPNPLTEAATARTAAGLPFLDLSVSNPTTVGLSFPEDWPSLFVGGGENGGQNTLQVYAPDPRGLPSARRAIAEYYRERNTEAHSAPALDADDFFLTAGTSEGYAHLFKLLCEPGDTILVPRPSYPLLDTLADLAGLTLASYPLIATSGDATDSGTVTDWRIDRHALTSLIGPHVKALIVVSPNNPTGNVLSDADAAWLLEFADQRGLALIVDEVFADYRHDSHTTQLLNPSESGPLVFTLNGLSKLVGLPQLKLAWIHVAGPAADVAIAKNALEWMCDAALSVGTAPQLACAPLLGRRAEFQGPINARLKENLATLRDITAGNTSLNVLWPQGGWCIPIRCMGIEDDEMFAIRLIEGAGVLVQPGYFFEFDDEETVVVSLLTPPDVFREGLTRIVKALA